MPYSKELGLLYFGSIGYFYFSDTIKQSLGERFFALTIFQFLGYGILVLLPEQSYWVVNGRSWGNIRDPVVQWLYGMLFVWICALTGRSDTVGELLTYFNISEAVNDATTAGNGLETGSKIMYELLMVSIVLSVLYLIFKKIEKKLSGNI